MVFEKICHYLLLSSVFVVIAYYIDPLAALLGVFAFNYAYKKTPDISEDEKGDGE